MSLENKSTSEQFEIPKLDVLSSPIVQEFQSFISKNQLMPSIIIISLIGLGALGYFYYQSSKTNQFTRITSTGQVLDKEQIKKLVAEIKNKADLPKNEDPNVATVVDIGKLKDQPFFAEGKNGDVVLMYANAKKVYLYDPIAQKIVNIAPLTVSNTPSPTQPTQQIQAKLALSNGTSVAGSAAKMETEIKKSFPEANIVSKENAKKDDYAKTIIVVLNETATDAAANLAKALNISIANLPSGEVKPTDADILIIIGKDRT